MEEIDNPEVLGLTLQTAVNRAYDGPGADDPYHLQAKCIQVLLLPRILDVLCFWVSAGILQWNYANSNNKYFAVRIFDPDATEGFWHTFFDVKTILATVAFMAITAVVFVLRVSFIKAKRAKVKEMIPTTKQGFPYAYRGKVGLAFSTVFFALFLTVAHFVASLIMKKNWDDMPVSVDLLITLGVIIAVNLRACLKVQFNVGRCMSCHVIATMANQDFRVKDTFYADASLYTPTQEFKSTTKYFRGDRLERADTTVHKYGEVRTYENVRHDRIRSSVRCPYCLQVYAEDLVNINDDFSDKKLKSISEYHDMKFYDGL